MLRHRLGFFLQKCIAARSSRRAAYSAALIGRMQCGPQLTCSALAGCVSRAGAEFFFASLACLPHPLQFCLALALPACHSHSRPAVKKTRSPNTTSSFHFILMLISRSPARVAPRAGKPGRTLALAPPQPSPRSIISLPPRICARPQWWRRQGSRLGDCELPRRKVVWRSWRRRRGVSWRDAMALWTRSRERGKGWRAVVSFPCCGAAEPRRRWGMGSLDPPPRWPDLVPPCPDLRVPLMQQLGVRWPAASAAVRQGSRTQC
jgi:hypothetical protein